MAKACFKGLLLTPTSFLGSYQALKFKMALAAVNIRSKWRPYWIECQTPWPRWESSSNIAKISFSLLFFLLIQILLKRILLLLSSRPLDDNPLQSFSLFSKLDQLVPLNFEILYRKKIHLSGKSFKTVLNVFNISSISCNSHISSISFRSVHQSLFLCIQRSKQELNDN